MRPLLSQDSRGHRSRPEINFQVVDWRLRYANQFNFARKVLEYAILDGSVNTYANLHKSPPKMPTSAWARKSLKSVDRLSIRIMISAMKRIPRISALPLLLLFSLAAFAEIPAGGFAGTWTANFAKSKFPGPPPKIDMCTIGPNGTVTVDETTSDGKVNHWSYTPVEGQPVSIDGRDGVMVTVRKVDDHTIEHSWTGINGKPAKSKAVLSKDGKTTTFTMDGVGKDGKPFHEMVVYDKKE
jgi:hypothetical protein